jgi:hypothetical protein
MGNLQLREGNELAPYPPACKEWYWDLNVVRTWNALGLAKVWGTHRELVRGTQLCGGSALRWAAQAGEGVISLEFIFRYFSPQPRLALPEASVPWIFPPPPFPRPHWALMSRQGPIAWPPKLGDGRWRSPFNPSRGAGASREVGVEARGPRTFQAHPHRQALLEAAEGTALALRLVDLAALALGARVVLLVLHRALEEALQERQSAREGPDLGRSPHGLRPSPARRPAPRPARPLTLQLSHVSSP